jgi:glycosyltransferase involved in cell wall biosynthesis
MSGYSYGNGDELMTRVRDDGVDLLYLACNRLEFTRETFSTLVANTRWDLVHELFVYDDGSSDGTREWLEEAIVRVPAPHRMVRTRFESPVAAMVHFIESASAAMLAKTDNDAMLPPGWLEAGLAVYGRHPELHFLGIEAMYPHQEGSAVQRSYAPAQFISGLGLYRRAAFARSRPRAYQKWFGLEEWQVAQGPGLVRGWIRPALPVFLLDRIPFEPWTGYASRYVERGWQRSWPKYDHHATLWRWWSQRQGVASAPLDSTPAKTGLRFVCAMRVKNEAEHIEEVIRSVLPLCDIAVVFDDHSTDNTMEICRGFGDRVRIIQSPFSGLDEARDKNALLAQLGGSRADWVLWIDGDEALERGGPDVIRNIVGAAAGVGAFTLRIAYLWNDANHVRVDGVYGRFTRPSLFRLSGQRLENLRFRPTGAGGNLHCGNIPHGIIGGMDHLGVRLKHFGYMTRQKRLQKYQWYNNVDPNNAAEDYYRHIAEIPGAHFAPGPAQLVEWTE